MMLKAVFAVDLVALPRLESVDADWCLAATEEMALSSTVDMRVED